MSEILGYIATVIVVLSYISRDIKKLRLMSITACVIFIIYASLEGLYPIIITNASIIIVNLYRIFQKKDGNPETKSK